MEWIIVVSYVRRYVRLAINLDKVAKRNTVSLAVKVPNSNLHMLNTIKALEWLLQLLHFQLLVLVALFLGTGHIKNAFRALKTKL